MTYKTKSILFVLAIGAMMLAWPLTAQTAFADGSTSSLNLECGVTTPGTIAFGSFSLDTPPAQQEFNDMEKLGAEIGTFDVEATDWLGVAQRASAAITVLSPIVGDVFTYETITVTVSATTDDADNFQLGATDAATAILLAAAINLNADAGDEATVDVDAVAVGTTVILRSDITGIAGNDVNIAQTTGTATLVASSATLINGEDTGVIHMLASNTKYTITVDGSSSSGDNYAAKTNLAATGVDLSLASQTESTTNLQMSLEINPSTANMLNLPYNGALTQTLTFTSLCNQT